MGSGDKRCCITGEFVAAEDFTGFDAAHIFPLSETDIVRCLPQYLPHHQLRSHLTHLK